MKFRKETLLLIAIFLVVFVSRLVVAFSSHNFTYDAYFNIRHAEVLKENPVMSFDDPLFYVPHPFMPLFHYVLAFFSLFISPFLVFKVVPNLAASLAVFLAYMISFELTKDRLAALFSALSVGFVPVFFLSTVNSISEYSFAIPLMLAVVYIFLKLDERKFVLYFIIALFALVFSHPSVLILVSGLVLYVLVIYTLNAKAVRAELEIILFSLILSVWVIFLFFKEPLLLHGFSVLWQNLPQKMIDAQFSAFDILDAIYKIGILTFVAGIFLSYRYVFEGKRRDIHVLISLSSVVLILLFIRLIRLDTGLMFLGIFFAVMSGEAYKMLFEYLEKTHLSKKVFLVVILLLCVFVATSFFASVSYKSGRFFDEPSDSEISAFSRLGDEVRGQVVFADLKEGNLVPAVSGQKSFVDSNLIMSKDISQRLADLETIYTTKSQVAAIELFDKYSISYLVITKKALGMRNITDISYYSPDCFSLIYENEAASVYKSLCTVSR